MNAEQPPSSSPDHEDASPSTASSTRRTGLKWIVIRLIAAVVGMFIAVVLPLAVLVPTTPLQKMLPDTPVVGLAMKIVVVTLTAASYILITFLLARFIDRSTLRRCGLTLGPRSVSAFFLALALTMALVIGTGLAMQAGGLLRAPIDVPHAGVPLWFVIAEALLLGFVMQGFGEELIWRGYVLRHLPVTAVAAIWLSAACFGLMHIVSRGGQENVVEHILYLANPFGFAVLAGALAVRTGQLWAAVAVHGGVHASDLVMGLLGYGSGPWMWVASGAVLTIAGVIVMRGIPRDYPAVRLQDDLPARS